METAKTVHEEIMNYKNYLVENTPDFTCHSPIVTHTEGMSDAEKMKYMAAVFLREAEFSRGTACKFAAENNIRWASHYLLEMSTHYDSYRMLLSVISRDWRGAAKIREELCLSGDREVLKVLEGN